MRKPYPGEQVFMRFDNDVVIEITAVPDVQPYASNDQWIVIDQYEDEHLVEADGQDWITVNTFFA